uniref:Putative ribonuclease H-like domain-containing protein n=1 Tax=Tanacetum cinerariifolium TaxID=118510 RepID=A0A6L2KQK0_TANCI|nr:putative ribonuclease H-like domain-containing protein [Tanacetum cinerariifolium]
MILNTLDYLGKFDAKGDEGYFIGYSMFSKAFRVFNKRTKRVEENLHVDFLDNKAIEKGTGPNWLSDIDSLTKSMNYVPVVVVHEALLESSSSNAQDTCNADAPESSGNPNPIATITNPLADQMETLTVETLVPTISLPVPTACFEDSSEPSIDSHGEEDDVSNMETTITASPTPTLRILKDHPKSQIIGPADTPIQTKNNSKEMEEQSFIATIHQKTNPSLLQFCLFSCFLSQVEPKKIFDSLQDPKWVEAMQEELLQFKIQNIWSLVDCPKGVRPIGTKWVLKNRKDERGIVFRNKARLVAQGHTQEERIDYNKVFASITRIEAIRLFLAYASFMGFTVYQMDVKSAFLYGTIDEEVYVMQPPGFQDPEFPARVYKVEKAMYGLHQAPRAWYGTLSKYLLTNGFQRGIIDHTLFIRKQRGDFILVQVYVDDIIFGSSNPQLCREFEALMHENFQMSAMGELNFFLGLQVLQKEDGIFLSQDKYVGDILKKFGYSDVRSANTPMDKENPWGKDGTGKDVDLHLYRSMIGSLMYLTSSRPDIMFAVCTPTEPHHTPSLEALQTSPTTHLSPSLPPVTTEPLPTAIPSDTPQLRQYTRRARIAQSSALPLVADELASPIGDDSQGEACPTDSGLEAEHDRANITKTSTLPSDSTPRLKARVKLLEDREGGGIAQSGEDAPIKGRSLDEGEEAVVERSTKKGSGDIEEMVTVLTSLDVSTILSSGVSVSISPVTEVSIAEVPTSSGFILTASIPTASPLGTGVPTGGVPTGSDMVPIASLIFTTATVATPYTRRKGKEKMVESETPKKKKIQEQMDVQMARQLEKEMERDAKRMNEQIARDAEIAKIHAEEELQIMIDRLDRNNETVAKQLCKSAQVPDSAKKAPLKEAIEDFIPIGSKEESERFKRKGVRLQQDSAKKVKTSEEVPEEKLKEMMQLIPVEEVYVEALQVKHLIIDWELWALVKETLNIRQAANDKEKELWVELKRLYEPDVEDLLWTHT